MRRMSPHGKSWVSLFPLFPSVLLDLVPYHNHPSPVHRATNPSQATQATDANVDILHPRSDTSPALHQTAKLRVASRRAMLSAYDGGVERLSEMVLRMSPIENENGKSGSDEVECMWFEGEERL